jgi:hypothetical protein
MCNEEHCLFSFVRVQKAYMFVTSSSMPSIINEELKRLFESSTFFSFSADYPETFFKVFHSDVL